VTYSIIPVREFADTKIRLSSILSRDERASLTKWLLKRVISANQKSELKEIFVVSPMPDEITLFLQDFGKVKGIRESHRHGGVNSAMNDGIEQVRKLSHDSKILLMPSDLPFLSSEVINKVIRLLDDYDLIINPSERKDGTNLLAFRLSKMIPLHYDNDSFSKHEEEAGKGELKFLATDWGELSFDVDDSADLNSLMLALNLASKDSLMNVLSQPN
jgi:2-phospho-L-lactate guanylyltransferase